MFGRLRLFRDIHPDVSDKLDLLGLALAIMLLGFGAMMAGTSIYTALVQ